MTTNPNWIEIQKNWPMAKAHLIGLILLLKYSSSKKQQLIRALGTKILPSKLYKLIPSIKFQKYGYPHAHIVIWID